MIIGLVVCVLTDYIKVVLDSTEADFCLL